MSDDGKCYAATPAATLEEHILNSNIAKSDTEWWAHHEISRLRAENEKLLEVLKPFADAASGDDYIDDIEIAETDTARKITFGNLRRARAAIECQPKKKGEG